MTRAPGSGLYRTVAEHAEELWAATIRRDGAAVAICRDSIDDLFATGRSGIRGTVLSRWFDELAASLALPVVRARRETPDLLGDVSAVLRDGTTVWFELKSQTTKATFDELTQADWVRDATTATSWLCGNDASVSGAMSATVCAALAAPAVPAGWGLEEAWLGDLLLLTDDGKRAAAGVTDRESMAEFAQRKFLVHTTKEGARVILLADLSPVAALIRGGAAHWAVHPRAEAVGAWLTVDRAPTRAEIQFSYNMGYRSGVLGRHKLHASPIRSDPWIATGSGASAGSARRRPARAQGPTQPPVSTPGPTSESNLLAWVDEGSFDARPVPGMRVRHRSKGIGTVCRVEGVPDRLELTIEFDRDGSVGTFVLGFGVLAFSRTG